MINEKQIKNKYSVLMSVYESDNPEFFRIAVRSMLNQTVRPSEFIIVEDGPVSEELSEAVREMATEGRELGIDFKMLPLKENGGLGNALDQGMKLCTNELIARMDSDDISIPDRCEKELACFERDQDLSIMSGAIAEFENDPDVIESVRRVPLTQDEIVHQMHTRSPFNHPAVMYRKSAVIKAGGYGHSVRKEDHDLFSRMLFGDKVKAMNIPDIILKYRIGKDNIKRRKSWKNVSSYFEIMRINRRRGYVSIGDCLFVYASQIFYFIMPERLLNFVIRKLLRKNYDGNSDSNSIRA